MTAILKEDPPDLAAARTDLPASLDRIVRHCLEKNPAERFQSARDVVFALESFPGNVTSSAARAALPAPTRRVVTGTRVAWTIADDRHRRVPGIAADVTSRGASGRSGDVRGYRRPVSSLPHARRAGHFA